MTFHNVVLGGTFDRLHTGHKSLLTKAFSVGQYVTIGLTTDEYVNTTKDHKQKADDRETGIFSYEIRKEHLVSWLNDRGWEGRYMITPLEDAYGPTISANNDFDAIVVSSQTRNTAERINFLRKEKGLSKLYIVEIPMVPAQDLRIVSSTRVRNGEIDVKGRLVLPDSLRPELKKSIGDCIPEKDFKTTLKQDTEGMLISVGDMTTEKILTHGYRPYLAIIDFQMKRKPYLWDREVLKKLFDRAEMKYIQSGPGYISRVAMQVIQDTFKGCFVKGSGQGPTLHGVYSNQFHTVLIVNGEEDLLVLPVLVEALLGSVLYYGQPNDGVVRVKISQKKKQLGRILMRKFVNQA